MMIVFLFIVGPIALYLSIASVVNPVINSEGTLSVEGAKWLSFLGGFCLVTGSILIGIFSKVNNGRFLMRSFRGFLIPRRRRGNLVFGAIVNIIIALIVSIIIINSVQQAAGHIW
jgi:predicted MFS family arabinose efflux permease